MKSNLNTNLCKVQLGFLCAIFECIEFVNNHCYRTIFNVSTLNIQIQLWQVIGELFTKACIDFWESRKVYWCIRTLVLHSSDWNQDTDYITIVWKYKVSIRWRLCFSIIKWIIWNLNLDFEKKIYRIRLQKKLGTLYQPHLLSCLNISKLPKMINFVKDVLTIFFIW